VDSIRELGLLHPITVTNDHELIAGRHRLEACRVLGWTDIPVNVVTLDALHRELAEIDENLIHNPLTVLERSEHYERRKQIYETLHPETKARSSERQTAKATGKPSETISSGFAADTAAKTGRTARTIQHEVQIAASIPSAVREVLRDSSIADNKTELLRVARIKDPGEQRRVADRLASGESKSVSEVQFKDAKIKAADQVRAQPLVGVVRHMSAVAFLNTIADASVDLLLTDPPYSTDVEDIEAFAASWLPLALSKVKPSGRSFVCVGAYPKELLAYLKYAPMQVLVWTYRNTMGPTPSHDYKLNWQAILYWRGAEAPPLDCDIMNEQFTVQDINAPDGRLGDRYHAWQKPDALAERLVRHATKSGDLVVDPFTCTGAFLIAATKLGRRAVGSDISEENLKIAISRGCRREG